MKDHKLREVVRDLKDEVRILREIVGKQAYHKDPLVLEKKVDALLKYLKLKSIYEPPGTAKTYIEKIKE